MCQYFSEIYEGSTYRQLPAVRSILNVRHSRKQGKHSVNGTRAVFHNLRANPGTYTMAHQENGNRLGERSANLIKSSACSLYLIFQGYSIVRCCYLCVMPNVRVGEYSQRWVFDVAAKLPKKINIEIGKTGVS